MYTDLECISLEVLYTLLKRLQLAFGIREVVHKKAYTIFQLKFYMAGLQSFDQLTQQLDSQGVADYVCFDSTGLPAVTTKGYFDNDEERCRNAFSLVQQASCVLRGDEKLKRVTAIFDECKYVATVVTIANQNCGVVIRRSN